MSLTLMPTRPVAAVIKSAEEEKKRKYNEAVEARRGSFLLLWCQWMDLLEWRLAVCCGE